MPNWSLGLLCRHSVPQLSGIQPVYVLFKQFLLLAIIRCGDPPKRRRCFSPPLEQKTEINPAPSGTLSEFLKQQIKLPMYQGEYQPLSAIHVGHMKMRLSCGLLCTFNVATVYGLSFCFQQVYSFSTNASYEILVTIDASPKKTFV